MGTTAISNRHPLSIYLSYLLHFLSLSKNKKSSSSSTTSWSPMYSILLFTLTNYRNWGLWYLPIIIKRWNFINIKYICVCTLYNYLVCNWQLINYLICFNLSLWIFAFICVSWNNKYFFYFFLFLSEVWAKRVWNIRNFMKIMKMKIYWQSTNKYKQ